MYKGLSQQTVEHANLECMTTALCKFALPNIGSFMTKTFRFLIRKQHEAWPILGQEVPGRWNAI